MPIHLLTCEREGCTTRFRVKVISKIKIGYFKGNSVILHYFECPVCKHIHVTKWDNPAVNKWSDKVFMAEWNMHMYRKEADQYEKYLSEYEIAKLELEKVTNEMKRVVSKNYKFIGGMENGR
ncbi:hypothetical protein ABC255_08700 [Neobacillus sp. 3P2-tot-E-2]|uniref:hypothetical protein n=1 Tax=Neobacillus sp. 3P2-tot-E-2 TaxID=3132212 RepID=UPI0039A22E3A